MLHVPEEPMSMGQPQPAAGRRPVRQALAGFDTAGLPRDFIERLVTDSSGGEEYGRIASIKEVRARPANSSYSGYKCASCLCSVSTLIPAGTVGRLVEGHDYEFLAPGYHRDCCCGVDYAEQTSVNILDKAVTYGTLGFVTVSEAKVGVMMVGASFKLLAPGTYQWASPRVTFLQSSPITQQTVSLGPYMLVTVPENSVAVTFNNGDLVVLGYGNNEGSEAARPDGNPHEPVSAPRRTYFLDNPKWQLEGFLPMVMQTDRLEENDLLSKDNVEVIMTAMSQWRIRDPVKAVLNCAVQMEQIRKKVDQLVRATIARIVAGTNIGAGPVSGAGGRSTVVAACPIDDPNSPVKPNDDGDLALLMKSDVGQKHMAELSHEMDMMGIEVCGVYVPEKRIKSDDIRREVAKQAVIGIRADAERAAADAKAYATVKAARAEAEAIELLATAHADAGARLGGPETTASRLALSETMSKVVKDAQLTIFSGAPDTMPFMFSGNPRDASRAQRVLPPETF